MTWALVGSALASAASNIFQNKTNRDNAEFSSATQYKYQQKLNKSNFKYNKKLIDYQNAFNEHMYDRSVEQANTAHQREVADMRAAGLNPILSATGGNGAGVVSPVTSGNSQLSSSAGMPSVENPDLMNAYSTHNQVQNDKRRVAYEEHNAHSLRNLQGAQTDLAASQTQKTTLEGDYQKLVNENAPTQIRYQNEQNAANVAYTNAQAKKVMADIQNGKAITAATVRNLDRQTVGYDYSNATQKAQADSIDRENKFYAKHPVLYGAKQVGSAVGTVLHGGASVSYSSGKGKKFL